MVKVGPCRLPRTAVRADRISLRLRLDARLLLARRLNPVIDLSVALLQGRDERQYKGQRSSVPMLPSALERDHVPRPYLLARSPLSPRWPERRAGVCRRARAPPAPPRPGRRAAAPWREWLGSKVSSSHLTRECCGKKRSWENSRRAGTWGRWEAHHGSRPSPVILCVGEPENCHLYCGHDGDWGNEGITPRVHKVGGFDR